MSQSDEYLEDFGYPAQGPDSKATAQHHWLLTDNMTAEFHPDIGAHLEMSGDQEFDQAVNEDESTSEDKSMDTTDISGPDDILGVYGALVAAMVSCPRSS